MLIITFSLLCASLWNIVYSLECYTGFSVIRGQTVGTTKEVCSKDTDSCYRAMADLNKNKCVEQELFGTKVMFCCCNDRDLCNSAPRPAISLRRIKTKMSLLSLIFDFPSALVQFYSKW
ncbi:unnamed protein product [Gongylonema pulchrum]|uniref:Activin_recp domain-containing protein n=1 Tax=Gongylonema pulchrum TaxID=637853 RepID=A0A183DYQ5_9BILA|nr:unnamed protein product [Gongylonema pulchrum]